VYICPRDPQLIASQAVFPSAHTSPDVPPQLTTPLTSLLVILELFGFVHLVSLRVPQSETEIATSGMALSVLHNPPWRPTPRCSFTAVGCVLLWFPILVIVPPVFFLEICVFQPPQAPTAGRRVSLCGARVPSFGLCHRPDTSFLFLRFPIRVTSFWDYEFSFLHVLWCFPL